MSRAFLILEDSTIFEGHSIGVKGQTIGEVVFTTGMTGYVETLTDPSYYGQIVTQTFPLIGNYGVMHKDFESGQSWVRGYVVRELCDQPSNFRCQEDLDTFLKAQNIVGICGIDTRALTKKLRESGVMNGMIVSDENLVRSLSLACPELVEGKGEQSVIPVPDTQILQKIKSYKIENALKNVQSDSHPELVSGSPQMLKQVQHDFNVVLFDFGAKANIQRELEKRGCKVTVVPYNTTAQEVLKMAPDGIMLSNGPGDPAENVGVIEEIKKLCEWGSIPIFGICLGHQMLALARGCKTCKLKYGHRGGNHPVKDTRTNRVYITSQNHGYAVENTSLPDFAELSFFNVNDGTVEGITYADIPAFSVQFHPEACGGPHDTNFLFDRFMEMMGDSESSSE